jgi:hypothetical protein
VHRNGTAAPGLLAIASAGATKINTKRRIAPIFYSACGQWDAQKPQKLMVCNNLRRVWHFTLLLAVPPYYPE